jgi:hypothetical protein
MGATERIAQTAKQRKESATLQDGQQGQEETHVPTWQSCSSTQTGNVKGKR